MSISVTFVLTDRQVESVRRQGKIASDVSSGAYDLGYLANDYVIYKGDEQFKIWQTAFESLSKDVADLKGSGSEQETLVRNIQDNTVEMEAAFDDIVANANSPSVAEADSTANLAFIRDSWDIISVNNHHLASDAARLEELIDDRIHYLQRANNIIAFVLIGIGVLYILVNYMVMQRRILLGIGVLQSGAKVIGSGDLDYLIEEKRNDEIGELSKAFNRMTSDLKSVTASKADLEKEMNERKRVQMELESLSKQRQLALDAAQMGRFHYDPVNDSAWFDERFKDIFELEESEDVHEDVLVSRVEPQDFYRILTAIEQSMEPENPQPYILEYRINLPDGSVKWIESYGTSVFEGEGMKSYPTDFVGTVRDITERKQVEEALHDSREIFRFAIENAPVPVILLAEDGKVLQVSRSWFRLTGYRQGDILTIDDWLSNVNGVDAEEARKQIREYVEKAFRGEKLSGSIEFIFRARDGNLREWRFVASRPSTLRSGLRFIVGIAEDITEQKKTERMKDEFLSLVSHELRTPLTVIGGSLEVALSSQASPEEVMELMQNAVESVGVLNDILENMLEMTRDQAGKMALHRETIDVPLLAGKVIKRLKDYGANQNFHMEVPEGLPAVKADPLRIERILTNLLDNAVKYSPEESEITVAAKSEAGYLVIGVKDQGKGIPKEDMDKLFQLFGRLNDSTSKPGIGLGLVVCQRLVDAHGGWIKVDSITGQGTTFSFGLPLESE